MTGKEHKTDKQSDAQLTREERLKAALKANLSRRKAQSRLRSDADASQKTETRIPAQDRKT